MGQHKGWETPDLGGNEVDILPRIRPEVPQPYLDRKLGTWMVEDEGLLIELEGGILC